jgi:retron-type reverse transcriptase
MPGYESQQASRQQQVRQPQQRQGQPGQRVPKPPSVQQIISFDNLLRAYQRLQSDGGQAPGPDGATYAQLGHRDACHLLRNLSAELQAGRYVSSKARSIEIPKASGGFRTLRIRSILHRVVASALHDAMTPYWEDHLLDVSHGFRPGRNVETLLKELEEQILQQQHTVILTADVRKAFDSVRIQDVLNAHHHYTQDQQLLDLVATVLVDPHSKQQRGIDQGNPYSPTALNVVLHRHLDAPIHKDVKYPLQLRYADDVTIPASSVPECQNVLDRARQLLEPLGLELITKAGPPMDLSQEGSQVRILGYELSLCNGKPTYGIPATAWRDLDNQLTDAYSADHPGRMAEMMVRGWIQGYRLAFENVTSKRKKELIHRLLSMLAVKGFREVAGKEVREWMA